MLLRTCSRCPRQHDWSDLALFLATGCERLRGTRTRPRTDSRHSRTLSPGATYQGYGRRAAMVKPPVSEPLRVDRRACRSCCGTTSARLGHWRLLDSLSTVHLRECWSSHRRRRRLVGVRAGFRGRRNHEHGSGIGRFCCGRRRLPCYTPTASRLHDGLRGIFRRCRT